MNYVKKYYEKWNNGGYLKKSHAAGDQVLQENLHKGTKIVPNGESKSQKMTF